MEYPFVSIIIPTHNSAQSLAACLDSIKSQSFRALEIILVDGLSTDETMTIAKSYLVSHPNIFCISEKDNGIYDAMNKGLTKAKGEWLYFLGSDDELHSETVLQEVFAKPIAGDINIVYGNVNIKGNTSWTNDGAIYDGVFDLQKLLKKNICHQAIFYKRTFVQKQVGYFNGHYKLCADWDFNLRCWAQSPFVYIDKIIANFNSGGASTISNDDAAFGKDFLNNVTSYFNLSIFDPLLDQPGLPFFDEVVKRRQQAGWGSRLLHRCKRKFNYFIHA